MPELDSFISRKKGKFLDLTSLKIGSGSKAMSTVCVRYPGISVVDPDPGSGVFLTSGSGIRNRFFRIPDLGSHTHIFESIVTIF
jgi:hypothetical protein